MMRRSLALLTTALLLGMAQATPALAQESRPSYEFQDDEERYSDDELDNLVGSVALYPDALLAQVLVAATFPDQIEDAARYVRANGTNGIDDQAWDVSVKSVAHYASALNMMADKSDWTAALGRAYATQSSDVMAAVQRMRRMADAQGNLRSNEQQSVSRDDDYYVIAPAQPRVIYVPVYDPYVVYTRPIFTAGYVSRFWSFGIGFPIGGWLSYDCNWRTRSVYYNGWDSGYYGYAGGWRARSRPYIHVTNIYVNPRYRNVYINRDIIRRRVVYRNIDRYPGVHRETRFGSRDDRYRGTVDRRPADRGRYDNDRRNVPDRSRYDVPARDRNDGWRRDVPDRGRTDGGRRDEPMRDRNDGGRPDVPVRDRNDGGRRDVPDRDVNRNGNGTWGRDAGWSRDAGRSPQRDVPSRGSDRPDVGSDRGRNDARQPERGRPTEVARAPRERNEQPMINPRRAEPQQQRGGGNDGGRNDGGRGGQRGGRGNEGRERPKF